MYIRVVTVFGENFAHDDDDDWLLFAEDAQFRVERSRSRLSGTVYA